MKRFSIVASQPPWIGKLLGALTGLIWAPDSLRWSGLVLGLLAGHLLDQRLGGLARTDTSAQKTVAALRPLFMLMGHLAKIDGRVNEAEIAVTSRLIDRMVTQGRDRVELIELFRQGKGATPAEIDRQLDRLADTLRHQPKLAEQWLGMLIGLALSDGALCAGERALIERIAVRIEIAPETLRRIESRLRRQQSRPAEPATTPASVLMQAYQLLQVNRNASDEEVKLAYRRKLSQHHPDRLQAGGASAEQIQAAGQQTHEIRSAYELIRAARLFRQPE